MGYRLLGPALKRNTERELYSHGLLPGVVQVPHGGQPIVLLADAQTSGGYPRIACVIEADLYHLAQIRPGGSGPTLCFVPWNKPMTPGLNKPITLNRSPGN